jgi:acetoacetyl-CoA synthetase
MDSLQVPRKLWEHPDPKSTEMYKFMQDVNKKHNLEIKVSDLLQRDLNSDMRETFWELYQYSITHRAQFWDQCFQNLDLIYSGTYGKVVDENARMDSIPRWFEGVYMNFAENLLYKHSPGAPSTQRGTVGKEDNKIAVTEVREGATEIRDVSWGQLRREVAHLASAMREHGVKKGDRVVVVASNSVDTLKVFLAATALGGIFSSSSTDMGVQGILQRALQVTPKV